MVPRNSSCSASSGDRLSISASGKLGSPEVFLGIEQPDLGDPEVRPRLVDVGADCFVFLLERDRRGQHVFQPRLAHLGIRDCLPRCQHIDVNDVKVLNRDADGVLELGLLDLERPGRDLHPRPPLVRHNRSVDCMFTSY